MRRASAALWLLVSPFVAAGAVGAAPDDLRELELRSVVFGNTRTVRVLLPPGYSRPENAARGYPVFVFTDGRAAFDGNGWDLPGTARGLWATGAIEEVIFVGVDNGGSTLETRDPVRDRAAEYLPYPDPTWDEVPSPEPRGDRFPSFLFDEVVPLVDRTFRTRTDTPIGLAGASYGGVIALYTAMQRPDRIGRLLIESPSLHVGDGVLLANARGCESWPSRVYIGVGTAEGDTRQIRSRMVEGARELDEIVESGTREGRTRLIVREGARHAYDAWCERLPEALSFLLGASKTSPPGLQSVR
jgi:predicted alpha/beta superfamily hydrolase